MDIINIELASHTPHGSGFYHIAVTVCVTLQMCQSYFHFALGWTGDKWGYTQVSWYHLNDSRISARNRLISLGKGKNKVGRRVGEPAGTASQTVFMLLWEREREREICVSVVVCLSPLGWLREVQPGGDSCWPQSQLGRPHTTPHHNIALLSLVSSTRPHLSFSQQVDTI